jgi:hypothetical protein
VQVGRKDCLVGQWSAKAVLSGQMQKHGFCTPYRNLMLAFLEWQLGMTKKNLNIGYKFHIVLDNFENP